MSKYGRFSGNPKTEWVLDPCGNDRNMKMLEDFSFIDPAGRVWMAEKSSIINGASIPRQLWTLIGSPYMDRYRRAAIVHDVACDDKNVLRKEADVMFFYACRAGGCSATQACVLYVGVRIGTWSKFSLPECALENNFYAAKFDVKIDRPEDNFIRDKFQQITKEMGSIQMKPSIEEADAIIAKHLLIDEGLPLPIDLMRE